MSQGNKEMHPMINVGRIIFGPQRSMTSEEMKSLNNYIKYNSTRMKLVNMDTLDAKDQRIKELEKKVDELEYSLAWMTATQRDECSKKEYFQTKCNSLLEKVKVAVEALEKIERRIQNNPEDWYVEDLRDGIKEIVDEALAQLKPESEGGIR